MDQLHYIHSRGGKLGGGADTTEADVDAIVAAFQKEPSGGHLILHFHGGLVPKASGLAIAERLLPVYRPGGYPIFFIWDTRLSTRRVSHLLHLGVGRLGDDSQ